MAYFKRLDETTFLPTAHTGGAWNVKEQHIAPVVGLLTHMLECNCTKRAHGFVIGRLSFDILGTLPLEPISIEIQTLRSGRTIELIEGTVYHNQRPALRARAWLIKPHNTHNLAGTSLLPIPSLDQMPIWEPSTIWAGDFIKSIEIRRVQHQPGRAAYWGKAKQSVLEDEQVSALAQAACLFDIPNGMTVRANPHEIAFPNLDVTVHLFSMPTGEWLGFDTSVSFGNNGLGVNCTILHDQHGPIGTVTQILTIRP